MQAMLPSSVPSSFVLKAQDTNDFCISSRGSFFQADSIGGGLIREGGLI